ncbi:Hsp20/alpha crystallin family protein [Pseudanabaena sp. PCC 6802]|uniref:Hsp20/alpha crystallin family protein n=1 Tax=Pseudanabaena sp. PCC 6802 TaxID=118173 RepID=UPI00034A9E8A|nr:Hsp20/alpha crystallin family protein [Pseudanabaena sp. PCC 6802]
MMIRLHPLHDFGTLSRQIDRVFEEIGNIDRSPKSVKSDWVPRAELLDSPDQIVLRVYLPGVDANNLDIEATRESIVISGDRPYQKPTEDRRYYWSEFNYGKFHRAFSLPVAVAHDRVQADYRDGILTIALPKLVTESKKTVKVQVGGQTQSKPIAVADAGDAIAA